MKSFEYDGANTAKMIGMDLMTSLGLSRQEIGEVFNHAVFDGVYVSSVERVRGGGCLSLMHHFAEWCGLSQEDFTGHWDMGHLLQLVYGEAILNDENFKKFNQIMYSFMVANKSGQAGLKFRELSEDLNFAILENKSPQATRWVRAQLRANQAFFRNLPALYQVVANEVNYSAKIGNLTKQKQAQRELDSLTSSENLAFGIGLCQILEKYANASLNIQNLSLFPTSVETTVNKVMSDLKKWSSKWEWESENLKLAGIGHPSELIANLEIGCYTSFVSKNAKQAAAKKINIPRRENLRIEKTLKNNPENLFEMEDLFNSETTEIEINDIENGEVPVTGFDLEARHSVEKKLESLCLKLFNIFKERVKIPQMFTAASQAFDSQMTHWYLLEEIDENSQTEKLRSQLQNLISEVKGPYAEYFQETIESCLIGYEMFLRHSVSEMTGAASKVYSTNLEQIYETFFNVFKIDETKVFRELFEFVQLKTYSEAICETIGSIMNMAQGKGRNLHPINFSKEIVLRYNLPPLHVLHKKFIPEIVDCLVEEKGREFIRRGDGEKRQIRKFTFESTSASLGNFRKNEEKQSHLPLTMF